MSLIVSLNISCAHVRDEADPISPYTEAGQNAQTARATQPADSDWPREFTIESRKITVYPPQVEKWSDHTVQERAAVSVQTPASPRPVYGRIWLTARTQVDPKSRRVDFKNVRVTRAKFPSSPEISASSLKAIRQHESELLKPVALDTLRSNLAIERAEARNKPLVIRNGPPKVIVSRSPTTLVLLDGTPVLRDAGIGGLMRVINTRALILYDSTRDRYFLHLGNRWMDARTLAGPWIETDEPPPSLEEAKRIAVEQKQVDLLDDPSSPLMKRLAQGIIPKVYVSTEPAEILETVGAPELQSIAGTKLLFVANSDENIFLNEADQNYYVLLSGRWFRAPSLGGPWKYVSAKKLPRDFAKIPENNRKGAVLASVAGTSQAGEAMINNEVPQTAKVDRLQASLDVKYDGPAQFNPIEQTSMKYAVNSQTPVIQVDPHSYYALQSGVWFESDSSQGPWRVAARVPAVIYTIPTSSPLYYITYVRVYDSSPDYVYTGYTPGYLGSYCCNDGVVVFGTGFYYPPWIGTVWYGPPVTFGIGFGWGSAFYPWWGPWWAGPVYIGYPYSATSPTLVGQGTVYQGWSSAVVKTPNPVPYETAFVGRAGQWSSRSAAPGTASGSAPGSAQWQARQPTTVPQDTSRWNPPPAPEPAPGMNAVPWGMGHAPSASAHIAAPPPAPPSAPAPAPAAPPPSGGGHAAAAGQAFPGGGWGAHK